MHTVGLTMFAVVLISVLRYITVNRLKWLNLITTREQLPTFYPAQNVDQKWREQRQI